MKTIWNECKKLFDIRALLVVLVVTAVFAGLVPGTLIWEYTMLQNEYDPAFHEQWKQRDLAEGRYRGSEWDFQERMFKDFGPVIKKEHQPELEKRRQKLHDSINRKIAENPVYASFGIHNYEDYREFTPWGALAEEYARFKEIYYTETGSKKITSIETNDGVRETIEGCNLYDPDTGEYQDYLRYYDKIIEILNDPASRGTYDIASQQTFNDITKVLGVLLPMGAVAAAILILVYFVKRNTSKVTTLCYTTKTGRRLWMKQTIASAFVGILVVALFCVAGYFLMEGVGMQKFYDCRINTILIDLNRYRDFVPENASLEEIQSALHQHFLYDMTLEKMIRYFIGIFFLFGSGLVLISTALFHKCRNVILGCLGVIGIAGVATCLTLRYIFMSAAGDWWLLFRQEAFALGALLCAAGIITLAVLYQKEKKKEF